MNENTKKKLSKNLLQNLHSKSRTMKTSTKTNETNKMNNVSWLREYVCCFSERVLFFFSSKVFFLCNQYIRWVTMCRNRVHTCEMKYKLQNRWNRLSSRMQTLISRYTSALKLPSRLKSNAGQWKLVLLGSSVSVCWQAIWFLFFFLRFWFDLI